jgi:TonB-linked SusC/RagA family outer membrane protein
MYKIFTEINRGSWLLHSSRLLLSMKFTFILLFVTFSQVNARSYGQNVSLSVKNAPLEKVFDLLNQQTGYNFLYDPDVLALTGTVSISLDNVSLRESLTKCLQNQPVTFIINDKNVVIKKRPQLSIKTSINELRITGIVTDENGGLLPGVSVVIKGLTTGTSTNNDGKYSITVAGNNQTLVFSSIGMKTQEINVAGRSIINVVMKEVSEALSDVVVVGYGVQKKSDITGAISSVNEASLKNIPASNVVSALQGQVAGVDIQRSGGNNRPGSTPAIRIRGSRSITGSNDPLYVVDGIPFNGGINNLNQDDIVSVEILKDASSTAIYGSRGANGVVLITTRRGKVGRAVINYNGYSGFVKPRGEYDMMSGPELAIFKKWAKINGSAPGTYTGLDDPKFLTDGTFTAPELPGLLAGTTTNWQKLVSQTGLQTNHELSVSGGTEDTQYAVSGGYYNETSIYPGQKFQRFTLKLSLDQKLGKAVKFGLNALSNVNTTNGESEAPLRKALVANPYVGPIDPTTGLLYGFIPGNSSQVWNPVANFVPGAVVETRRRFGTFATGYLEAEIIPGLKYRFNGGAELRPETYGTFYSSSSAYTLGGASQASNNNGTFYNYTLENLLIYDKDFGKHHLGFTGLYSLQEQRDYSTTFKYTGLLSDGAQYYNPALGSNLTGSGAEAKYDIISYMGRLNYSYNSKYLLTVTMRSDGSSVLAPGNKYHIFPSAAIGWNINQETFMRKLKFISSLKLRGSFGSVGNAAVDPYTTLGRLSSVVYNYGNTTTTGVYPTNVPNPNLTWEYTATANAGLDFGLLGERITGSIELYHQYTRNLLLAQSLPASSGIPNATLRNSGKTENKGIELSINTVNVNSNAFHWSTNFNITFNRNEITELSNGVNIDVANNRFVGYPINPIYNYQKEGIWQATAADTTLAKNYGLSLNGPTSVIGTIKVADINGDGKIDANDRAIIGATQPKFTGGFTNRFAFKNIDLVVVSIYKAGGRIQAALLQSGSAVNSFQGVYNNLDVNYWTINNPTNDYPKPNFTQANGPYNDLLGIVSGSYLKIRSLSLGYSLPDLLTKKLKAKRIRFYATANNPFIFFSPFVDKYFGLDPETNSSVATDSAPTKSWLFGLNASF